MQNPVLSREPFEKAQNGNGRALPRVGMNMRLAPQPLDVGAWILARGERDGRKLGRRMDKVRLSARNGAAKH